MRLTQAFDLLSRGLYWVLLVVALIHLIADDYAHAAFALAFAVFIRQRDRW